MNDSQKNNLLIHYLNIYLSKQGLLMKPVLRSIKQTLTRSELISTKQFQSVIKFIEREPEFRGMNRNQITHFFGPLIKGTQIEKTTISTLDPYFKETSCHIPIHS